MHPFLPARSVNSASSAQLNTITTFSRKLRFTSVAFAFWVIGRRASSSRGSNDPQVSSRTLHARRHAVVKQHGLLLGDDGRPAPGLRFDSDPRQSLLPG